MRQSGTYFRLAVVLLLLTPMLAAAQQQPNSTGQEAAIQQMVDGIIKPFLSQHHIPGAIVGVSLHGKTYFFPYGKATDAGAPFTPDTLVEIGSCTKVFTTTLFALAAQSGSG